MAKDLEKIVKKDPIPFKILRGLAYPVVGFATGYITSGGNLDTARQYTEFATIGGLMTEGVYELITEPYDFFFKGGYKNIWNYIPFLGLLEKRKSRKIEENLPTPPEPPTPPTPPKSPRKNSGLHINVSISFPEPFESMIAGGLAALIGVYFIDFEAMVFEHIFDYNPIELLHDAIHFTYQHIPNLNQDYPDISKLNAASMEPNLTQLRDIIPKKELFGMGAGFGALRLGIKTLKERIYAQPKPA